VLMDGKPAGKDPALELMGRVSLLCNDAELFQADGVWKVEGDPTEGALYPFAGKLGMRRHTAAKLNEKWVVVIEALGVVGPRGRLVSRHEAWNIAREPGTGLAIFK